MSDPNINDLLRALESAARMALVFDQPYIAEVCEKALAAWNSRPSQDELGTALPPMPDPACTFADHSFPAFSRRQMIVYAQKAARLGVAAPKWRPIESAPRDGTHIILAFGQDGSSEGWWVDDDSEPRPWCFIDIADFNEVIINRSRDGEYGPSHWMPMPHREPRNGPSPAPPAASTQEGAE